MFELGGGVIDLYCKVLDKYSFSVTVLLDVVDAMGANTINTTLEGLKPFVMDKLCYFKQKVHKSEVNNYIKTSPMLMSIVSNLAPERITRVGFKVPVKAFEYKNGKAISLFPSKDISGLEVCQRICMAGRVAKTDLFRAVTHNKGIMNGIDAVLIAMGQDSRAVEAACHVYSLYRYGRYQALSEYYLSIDKDNEYYFCGELEIPISIGTRGGVLNSNPLYNSFLKMMKIEKAKELAQVIACVGLANNLAALRALVTEGIQKGHMRLHAKNIALSVGIPLNQINDAVSYMSKLDKYDYNTALKFKEKLMKGLKNKL